MSLNDSWNELKKIVAEEDFESFIKYTEEEIDTELLLDYKRLEFDIMCKKHKGELSDPYEYLKYYINSILYLAQKHNVDISSVSSRFIND